MVNDSNTDGQNDGMEDVVDDPWAIEDANLNAANNTFQEEQEEEPKQSETTEAISKLRASSARLGGAIASGAGQLGQQLGIQSAISQISSSVPQISPSATRGVTSNISQVGSSIGNWLSTSVKQVDSQFQISDKTRELGSKIQKVLPTDEIAQGLQHSKQAVQSFDETHGITKRSANALAAGADMLTRGLTGDGNSSAAEEDNSLAMDATHEKDKDGLPSSFQ